MDRRNQVIKNILRLLPAVLFLLFLVALRQYHAAGGTALLAFAVICGLCSMLIIGRLIYLNYPGNGAHSNGHTG